MADEDKVEGKRKPDYSKDENAKARMRAGRRSSNRNAGKPLDEDTELKGVQGFEEGGIVAEAQEEAQEVSETPKEEAAETPKEEAAEPSEVPEEVAEEPTEEVKAEEPKTAIEQFAEEESKEPEHQQPFMPENEYQAPEGESHEDLVDQYHEALAYGDMDTAKTLYRKLQEHRYQENSFRAKTELRNEQEAQEYLAVAQELAAAHPELSQDGVEADKVLALADVYRKNGVRPVEALQKAVADLYPVAETPAAPMEEETPVEELKAEEAPAEESPEDVIDMNARKLQKRNIPAMPSASARNEPPPPPKQPSRNDAIAKMKAMRGQA